MRDWDAIQTVEAYLLINPRCFVLLKLPESPAAPGLPGGASVLPFPSSILMPGVVLCSLLLDPPKEQISILKPSLVPILLG